MKTKFYYNDNAAPLPNKPNHIGTSVLILHDGRLLLERRQDSDTWAVIGGGLLINEKLVQGAIRETYEETGIVLTERDMKYCKIYDDPTRIASYPDGNVVRIITVVYLARLETFPELHCSEESKELRFFTKEEIKELNIARTHIPIINDYLCGCY